MNLYLNEKLLSIQSIDDLHTLLTDYVGRIGLTYPILTIEDHATVRPIIDHVREFVEFYLEYSGRKVDKGIVNYATNRLYEVKGSPEIFNVMAETMELSVDFSYIFPNLEILNIDSIIISDPNLFKRKLELAIYQLLFYDQFNLVIENLTILIQGVIYKYSSYLIRSYLQITPTLIP
jgi:hypothetical protein